MKHLNLLLLTALLLSFNARSQYSWSNQNSGSWNLHSIYFVNNFYGYAGGAGGTLLRTLDGGSTGWNSIAGPTANLITGIYFSDVANGFIVDDQSYIYRTSNSGTDWTQVYTPQGGDQAYSITESGGRLFVSRVNEILISDDNGDSWTPISVSTTGSILDISFSDADHGWACGVVGGLMWTDDNGDSWNPVSGPGIYSANDFNGIHAFTPNDFICVGATGTIFSSTDGGLSWGFPSASVSGDLNDISFADASNGIIVGDANNVFYTTNGGVGTWSAAAAVTSSANFYAVDAKTDIIAYMAGTGEEIWRSPDGVDDIMPLTYDGPDTVCVGQPFDFTFTFTNVGGGPSFNTGFTVVVFGSGSLFGDTISWSGTLLPGDTVTHTEPGAVLTNTGSQTVTIFATELNNQSNSALLVPIVAMAPDPTDVTGGTNFCPGDTVVMEASGGLTYNWLNTTGSNPLLPIQEEYPTVDISYVVQIQQQYCMVTDSATMLLDPGCLIDTTDTSTVIIDPTPAESYAFSPNNDGVNDVLVLDFLDGLVTPNNVQIYNRWGDIIYQTDDYDNVELVWDGSYGERTAPVGTYYFIAEADNIGSVKGWIQLLR